MDGTTDEAGEFEAWLATWKDLPKYDDGKVITYTVKETSECYDYVVIYPNNAGYAVHNGTITNRHIPQTTEIEVEKVWDDAYDQDGYRPESITVNLFADGVLYKSVSIQPNEDGFWSYKFTDLPVYNKGKEISYSITEDQVEEYDEPVIVYEDGKYTITNKHTPELTSIYVKKLWDDANNQDGIRPEKIIIHLLADGDPQQTVELYAKKNAGTDEEDTFEDNDWEYTFDNLPKYTLDRGRSRAIEYSVTEEAVYGYETVIIELKGRGYQITNRHTTEVVSLHIEKVWNDNNNQQKKRPESITVNIFANDELFDSIQIIPDEEGNWSYDREGLDKFSEGEEIIYTIEEEEVEEYTTTISGDIENGFTITNTVVPDTGDSTNLSLWVSTLGMSLFGSILAIAIYLKKESEEY